MLNRQLLDPSPSSTIAPMFSIFENPIAHSVPEIREGWGDRMGNGGVEVEDAGLRGGTKVSIALK